MVNLFDFASNDQALFYLNALFGTMNGIIPPVPGSSSSQITLLGTMFKTFNSAILTVGALMVVYTTVVGVIMTAHEGEFMGKKWNNLWIPLRMVIGIAALVPTGSGYSMIQLVMMWVIVQGVGAADTLWNTVINYINLTGSPYASLSLPSVGAQQSISLLFQQVNCHVTSQKSSPNPYINSNHLGDYFCADPKNWTNEFCKRTGLPIATKGANNTLQYQFGPSGSCGGFTTCDPTYNCSLDQTVNANKLACIACTAQSTAMVNIMGVLQNIAASYADADYAYLNYYVQTMDPDLSKPPTPPSFVQAYCTAASLQQCTQKGGLPEPGLGEAGAKDTTIQSLLWPYGLKPTVGEDGFISTNVDYYMNTISDAVNAYISSLAQSNTAASDWQKTAMSTGWIFAGAYYYQIAQMSQSNFTGALPTLSAQSPNVVTGDLKNYRNNYSAAGSLMASVSDSGGSVVPGTSDGGQSVATAAAIDSVAGTFKNMTGSSSKTNPIASLVAAGQALLGIASALFAALLIATFIVGLFGGFSAYVLGTGIDNPGKTIFSYAYFFLAPMFLAFIGTLISLGGLLAVYVPLIPYMIFTFGAVAWFLMTVEAMVAGPLVALGILSPSGHHEMLGKSEPALMLIFGIFLRPSLMIFGMMAAMLLAYIVKAMIDAAYWQVAGSIMGSAGRTPLAYMLFLATYVFFVIAALNKCFAAIYIVPQQVMTWIGGHARDGGEAGGLEEAKGGFQRGAAGVGGAHAYDQAGAMKGGAEAKTKLGKGGTEAAIAASKPKTPAAGAPPGGGEGGGNPPAT